MNVDTDCILACRCVSIDGDADRVVYFALEGGRLRLYDGDRIAVLAARLINSLLAKLGAAGPQLKVWRRRQSRPASLFCWRPLSGNEVGHD